MTVHDSRSPAARWAALLSLVVLAGGCGTRKCKSGTLLVSLTLTGDAARATSLSVDTTVDGGGEHASTVNVPADKTNGTIEVDFSKYPAGKSVTVTITALDGDTVLGVNSGGATLSAGCDVLLLSISAGSDGSASSDGAPADAGLAQDGGAASDGSVPSDGGLSFADGSMLTLNLLAGGLGGLGNADDVGIAARFSGPAGVLGDAFGNLYITDANDTIRKLVLSSGAVSTIAGTAGTAGSSNGTGSAARFYAPLGLALDGAGNLYVADSNNEVIRAIHLSTAVVTTFAGTVGAIGSTDADGGAARFDAPIGLAADANNLYVADFANHTIRQIVIATHAVSTLAGTAGMSGTTDATGAAARFGSPYGLVVAADGNLYVADTSNDTIRKVTLPGAVVTTLAGTAGTSGSNDGTGAAARFNQPRGLTADGAGHLFVADTVNHTIRQITLSTGAVFTLAGIALGLGDADGAGANARFHAPGAITTDPAGNVYVADTANNIIREVVPSPTPAPVSTIGGAATQTGSANGTGAAARFFGPRGAIADENGNVYVSDASNHTIRKILLATGEVTTFAGTVGQTGSTDGTGSDARFKGPQEMALDGMGYLYVSDTNDTIRKIKLDTAEVSTLAGTADSVGSVDGTGANARFNFPEGLAIDNSGNLYVADNMNHIIRRVVLATGEVVTIAGTALMNGSTDGTGAAARFFYPAGVAADANGNLFVADTANNTIRKIVVATGVVTTIAGSPLMSGTTDGIGSFARFKSPASLAADNAGNLYVADQAAATIRKLITGNGTVSTVVGVAGQVGTHAGALPGRLNIPDVVKLLPGGGLLIVDTGENAVLTVR